MHGRNLRLQQQVLRAHDVAREQRHAVEHAGDMVSEISVAMSAEMGFCRLANVIHPYPTAAEAMRQCGDAYNRTRLTPTVRKVFNRLMVLQC